MNPLRLLATALAALALACPTFALSATNTFENVGVVEDVHPATGLVVVDGQTYRLPNRVQQQDSPVIFLVRQGQTASFSGKLTSDLPEIESFYIIKQAPLVPFGSEQQQ
ncbi:TPA: PilY2 family type 4a fimbrial biogenesis protein [Pseudomonas aeruginosa]